MTMDSSKPAWSHNVGGFEKHYAGWRIGSPDGVHFTAQRRLDGRPRGPRLRAHTLDELAVLIEAQLS
jgi:hypothetical protein